MANRILEICTILLVAAEIKVIVYLCWAWVDAKRTAGGDGK